MWTQYKYKYINIYMNYKYNKTHEHDTLAHSHITKDILTTIYKIARLFNNNVVKIVIYITTKNKYLCK